MERIQPAIPVSCSASVAVDTALALPALETILKEFGSGDGGAALALNIRQLHLPFEAALRVPVRASIHPGGSRNEWRIEIRAARNPGLYPAFEGILAVISAANRGCQLKLEGTYAPPLGQVGRAIDATLLRGAARSSLERFVREVAHRVAALARFASIR